MEGQAEVESEAAVERRRETENRECVTTR